MFEQKVRAGGVLRQRDSSTASQTVHLLAVPSQWILNEKTIQKTRGEFYCTAKDPEI